MYGPKVKILGKEFFLTDIYTMLFSDMLGYLSKLTTEEIQGIANAMRVVVDQPDPLFPATVHYNKGVIQMLEGYVKTISEMPGAQELDKLTPEERLRPLSDEGKALFSERDGQEVLFDISKKN